MDGARTFGMLLRQYRLAASLSQEALAECSGLSANGIAALERGRSRAPRPATVVLLAGALDLAPAERAALIAAAGTTRMGPADHPGTALPQVPAPLTSFIGRGRELAELKRLLIGARLLTLTGTAGIGKTRLALEILRDPGCEAAFVDLASLEDGLLLPQAVGVALGLREQPERSLLQTTIAFLQTRRLLLVLDNCEHLVAACADLAHTLLQACPHLQILATSRQPLGVPGEVLWPVPALSMQDSEALTAPYGPQHSDAVRLFVERGRAAARAFVLTDLNRQAVAEICVQLDGIPLAIELAAVLVRMLSPAEIAARLNDRFKLLAGGSRTAPARHQTLRATVDWSYELLDAAEQRLFERLAVFAGGWTLEAAETVCAGGDIERTEVVRLLGRLVDQSLVLAEPAEDATTRYRLLETVRAYAAERLELRGEKDLLAARHRAWFLTLGQQAFQGFWQCLDWPSWWRRLAPEQANFRAALSLSLDRGEAEPGMRLITGLWVLRGFRGPWAEGQDWVARLLALAGAAGYPDARADALTVAGQMAAEQGENANAQALLLEAVELQRQVGGDHGLSMALLHAGLAARAGGEFVKAQAFEEEAVAIARAAGNKSYEAVCLAALAHALYMQGEDDRARRLAEDSLAIMAAMGHGQEVIMPIATIPLSILGRVALSAGDYQAARRYSEADVALWRELGELESAPGFSSLTGLAYAAIAEGDLAPARDLLAEALALSERSGSRARLPYVLDAFTLLAAAGSQPERALRLAGATEALRSAQRYPLSPADQAVLERWLGPARTRLGDDVARAAWTAGLALSADEAVECARSILGVDAG